MMLLLPFLCIGVLIVTVNSQLAVDKQQYNNFRGAGRKGRRRKDRPIEINLDKDQNKAMMKALTINYPLHIFDTNKIQNWRSPGKFSAELERLSNDGKPYKELARAQDQEDIWLYENWFYGIEEGIIMESGALNGIIFSTSYMFENFANWTAIHVEADPENYAGLKMNRERGINVHGALCSEPKLLHYSSVGVLPVRGFVEFMTTSFLKKWHGRIYNNRTRIDELPTVQCLPVKNLLFELNVKHIDIWILDVEGAEESVLMGTDFKAVTINAVAMECDEHDISKNKRKTDIVEANGFKCTLVERNCMCINNSYKPHRAPSLSELYKWDGVQWKQTYNPKG